MKKLAFFLFVVLLATQTFGQFAISEPSFGDVYYSQNGYATIPYELQGGNDITYHYSVRYKYGNGAYSDWVYRKSGEFHVVVEANTFLIDYNYTIQARLVIYDEKSSSSTVIVKEVKNVKVIDNDAPPAPNNLSYSADASYHPVISWSSVNKMDVTNGGDYKIYRKAPFDSDYGLLATVSGTTTSYTDTDVDLPHPGGLSGNTDYYYKIQTVDCNNNSSALSSALTVEAEGDSPLKSGNVQPTDFALLNNYPNPFNPSTKISFNLPSQSIVNISVYNVLGEMVSNLIQNQSFGAGQHSVSFNAANLPSGMYLYNMNAIDENGKEFNATNKMILSK